MSKIIYNDRAYGEIIGGGGAGGLGGGIELTQAEYNALDQSEKDKDIIYFITDGNPEGMVVNDSVPIGSIQAYAGANPPGNWLICAGQAVSRTQYEKLFNVIGTTYGEGDGSTTFNLPDLRGKVTIGQSSTYELGASGGEETHILTENELPVVDGSIAWHGQEHGTHVYHVNGHFYGTHMTSQYQTTGATSGAESWADVGYKFGNDEAHNNMQPYLVTNYIIKALDSSIIETEKPNFLNLFYPVGSYYETQDATFDPNTAWGGTWELEEEGLVHIGAGEHYELGNTGGEATHTLTVNEMPNHTHTMFYNGGSATTWGYNYTSSGGTRSAQTEASGGIGPTGGSQAHNNMQPYKVVNRWLRTA